MNFIKSDVEVKRGRHLGGVGSVAVKFEEESLSTDAFPVLQ